MDGIVRAAAPSTARGWPSTRRWLLGSGLGRTKSDVGPLALIFGIAFVVRIFPVLLGGGLTGLHSYDDGVYFGAAIALVEGVLPYRDYLLLHPPGEPVALLPFALIGTAVGDEAAFALARLATMSLGAVSAVLAALVAGRHLRLAGIVAGLLYATWNTASNSDRTTDLHTVQSALVLASCLVLVAPGRIGVRRAAVAGIPLGLATSVQLWQAVTVAVFLWWVAVRAPRDPRGIGVRIRPALAFGLASVAAFATVCLPFLVAAPWAMVRHVLVDQVGRLATGGPMIERLRVLEGLPRTSQLPVALRDAVPDVAVVVVAVTAFALLVVTAVRLTWTRPWAILSVATAGVVMLTPSFFNDYVSFVAPAAALALGSGLGWIAARLLQSGGHVRLVLAAGAALLVAVASVSVVRREGVPLDTVALVTQVEGATCVSSDHATLLVVTGSLRTSIANGCSIVLDPTGIRHDADRTRMPGGKPAPTIEQAIGYQAALLAYHGGSDVALMTTTRNFTSETRAAIARLLPDCQDVGIVRVCRRGP